MAADKMIVKTRKKMNRMIIGLVLLLIVEFLVLTPLIGAIAMGVMFVTFLGAMWFGNRITDPLLERGDEALTHGTNKEREGEESH